MNNTQKIKSLGGKIIKFEDYRQDIINALHEKHTNVKEQVTLLDWFFIQPVSATLPEKLSIAGPKFPMIGLVWNTTGRVYFVALKILLPDIF